MLTYRQCIINTTLENSKPEGTILTCPKCGAKYPFTNAFRNTIINQFVHVTHFFPADSEFANSPDQDATKGDLC